MVVAGDDETLLMIMINDGKSDITSCDHIFVLFPLGTSPSTVLSTAGHKKKLEVGHSTVKFQEKKGE